MANHPTPTPTPHPVETETKAPAAVKAKAEKLELETAVPGADPSKIETIKVKTSGNFHLQDPFTGALVEASSDGTDVIKTDFITEKLDSGELLKA